MSLVDAIKLHEGFSPTVYKDTLGYDTIGYGFAIKDLEITEEIAEQILEVKIKDLVSNVYDRFEWVAEMPLNVRNVIFEMCYQMGIHGFSKFFKTIEYLKSKEYKLASLEMLDSKWARQTPNRAKQLSKVVKNEK